MCEKNKQANTKNTQKQKLKTQIKKKGRRQGDTNMMLDENYNMDRRNQNQPNRIKINPTSPKHPRHTRQPPTQPRQPTQHPTHPPINRSEQLWNRMTPNEIIYQKFPKIEKITPNFPQTLKYDQESEIISSHHSDASDETDESSVNYPKLDRNGQNTYENRRHTQQTRHTQHTRHTQPAHGTQHPEQQQQYTQQQQQQQQHEYRTPERKQRDPYYRYTGGVGGVGGGGGGGGNLTPPQQMQQQEPSQMLYSGLRNFSSPTKLVRDPLVAEGLNYRVTALGKLHCFSFVCFLFWGCILRYCEVF